MRREIGLVLAIAVTVNAMVGTGIFRLSPRVLRLVGSSEVALFVWGLGGVIALCGALCIGELSAALPRAGGIYEFLRRAYGPSFAFVYGFTRLVLLGPSAAGSFSRLAAESLDAVLGLTPDPSRATVVSSLVLIVCTIANLRSVRSASHTQALLTAVKYAGLVLLAGACFLGPSATPPLAVPAELQPASSLTWPNAFMALVSVMWAYDGWADMSSLAGEAKDPARTLPRALVIGTAFVTLAYVITNLGYTHALSELGVASATTGRDMVAMHAAEVSLGEAGRRVLAALVFVSCFGACMVGILTGSRVFVSMGTDRLFFESLSVVSERGVPVRAVVLTSSLGILYLSVRSFEQLTDSFVVGMFPFYMLSVIAVPLLRRKEPALVRPFKTPAYPLVALIFLSGATALLVGAFADIQGIAYGAIAIMLAGFPVGALWRRLYRAKANPSAS